MDSSHAALVADFLRQVWDPKATPDGVLEGRAAAAAVNTIAPGEPPPTFLFLRDGRVAGFVTTLPYQLWQDGRTREAYWLNGLMVLPEFRNGPIGFLLLKEAVKQLPCAMALSVASPARRLFEALGFTDVGVLPNFVRIVQPRPFLAKLDLEALGLSGLPAAVPGVFETARRAGLTPLMALIVGAMDGLYRAVRARGGSLAVEAAESLAGVEMTALWEAVRDQLPAGPVRDLGTWRARYEIRREGQAQYGFVIVRDAAGLRAVAAVRRPNPVGDERLKGIKVATLSDLLCRPDDAAAAMGALRGADMVAARLEADALLCTTSMPQLATALGRAAYIRLGGNLHLLVRDAQAPTALPTTLAGWHVMRGDAHADEVF
jgi:GNAT superfamily N-acetyltransferase